MAMNDSLGMDMDGEFAAYGSAVRSSWRESKPYILLFSILFNQLNNWLAQIEINIKYMNSRMGTNLNSSVVDPDW